MDIYHRIRRTDGLTPVEQRLAATVLSLGDDIGVYSIGEFARVTSTSVASIHRFCRKVGLGGYKDLKIEVARASSRQERTYDDIDFDFPFDEGSDGGAVAERLGRLYEGTVEETRELLDPGELDRIARLLNGARRIDVYAHAQNLYAAEEFEERLMCIGKRVQCPRNYRQQAAAGLSSDPADVAVVISYSGRASFIPGLLHILRVGNVPAVMVGGRGVEQVNPGLVGYLHVSSREDPQVRIAQFSSDIAIRYVLDVLYGTIFALDYAKNVEYLRRTLPLMDNRRFADR